MRYLTATAVSSGANVADRSFFQQLCPSAGKACGVGNFANNLASAMRDAGIDVRTLTSPHELTRGDLLIQHEFALYDSGELTDVLEPYDGRKVLFAHSRGAEAFAEHVDAFVALCDGVVKTTKPTLILPHPGWQAQVADRASLKARLGWSAYRCVVGTNGFISPSRQFDEIVDRLIEFAVAHNVLIQVACPRHGSHDDRPGYRDQEERLIRLGQEFSANLSIETRFLHQQVLNMRLQASDLLWCWTSTPSQPYGSGTCSDQYGSGTRLVVADKRQHSHLFGLPNVVVAPPEIDAFVETLKSEILRRRFDRHDPSRLSWPAFAQRLRQFLKSIPSAANGESGIRPRRAPPAANSALVIPPRDAQRTGPLSPPHGGPRNSRPAPPEALTESNAARLAGEYLESVGPCPDEYHGRGIVICAGGVRYNACAWVTINMLRWLGCKLPIEVWYRGFYEYDEAWLSLVEPLGVHAVDADEVRARRPHSNLGGWQLKPYAILNSRFREVLLLDADNVPVVDPTYLFELPEFKAHGGVFWPDQSRTPPQHPRWEVFGVEYRDEPEAESGQVLVEKQLSWRALNLCNWYNERSEFFYRFIYGDKDTFTLAWHRAGQRYAMPPRGSQGVPFTICQHDFAGRRIFQHRVGDKFSLAQAKQCRRFLFEDQCLRFIDELREKWCPLPGLLRALSDADLLAMARLSEQRFRLDCDGTESRPIRLDGSGRVAHGQGAEMSYWWARAKHRELVLFDAGCRPTCRLFEQPGGNWTGKSLSRKGAEIQLALATEI